MSPRRTAVLGETAATAPGTIVREAGAQVRGKMVQDVPLPPLPFVGRWSEDMPGLTVPPLPELPEVPALPVPTPPARLELPTPPQPTNMQKIGGFVGRVFGAMFMSLLAIAVGMLPNGYTLKASIRLSFRRMMNWTSSKRWLSVTVTSASARMR